MRKKDNEIRIYFVIMKIQEERSKEINKNMIKKRSKKFLIFSLIM